ncbi:hypothetical protein FRB99_007126 [Tulasnella sp. 403]|nr:hypothetical protein FRB99_007126 [Tulasnella sp. 403]
MSWAIRLIRALSLLSVVAAQETLWTRDVSTVDAYVATQGPASKDGLLANIGPNGAKASGAHSGVVIASPSTSDPNYLYTWIRDSSLVYKLLVDQYAQGDSSLQAGIDEWVSSQGRLQQVSNPSGTVSTGGLGEPKFNINETAFTDPWGRPQRDGPGLRAISMITYADYISAHGSSNVKDTIWPFVKLDLDYVSTYWSQPTFDLWEEVNGDSFWTTAMQHRTLRQGAAFATAMGDSQSAKTYTDEAANALCFLQTYWSSDQSFALANMNTGLNRSGLDVNTILTSIHSFDPNASCEAATFQPCSDKALANHFAVVNSFRGDLYGINSGVAPGRGVAIGRYKEDVYYNDFLTINAKYTPSNGSLSEQFDKQTGNPDSAADLTWSYASALTAFDRRSGKVPASWGAAGLTPPSGPCKPSGNTVAVNFEVTAETTWGENIYITGNLGQLANWNADGAIALNAASYPIWKVTLNLPPSTKFEFKYIRKGNGAVVWESDPDNQGTTPASGEATFTDSWR